MSVMNVMNVRKVLQLDRSRQLSALAHHGLDYQAGTVGLERFAFTRRLFGHAYDHAGFTQPEHLRIALEAS